MYLYGFVNNQLLDKGKITIYCRSADNITTHNAEEIFNGIFKTQNIEEIQRIQAHCIAFEINFISESEIEIDTFIDINHELKFTNIQLVEVMAKQICKKIHEKIKEICSLKESIEKYCPKLPTELQKNFANFYSDLTNMFHNKLQEGVNDMPNYHYSKGKPIAISSDKEKKAFSDSSRDISKSKVQNFSGENLKNKEPFSEDTSKDKKKNVFNDKDNEEGRIKEQELKIEENDDDIRVKNKKLNHPVSANVDDNALEVKSVRSVSENEH